MVLSLQNTGVPSARRTPNCERPGARMIAFVACGGTFVKPLYEKTRTRGSARQCLALHISPAMSSEPNHPLDNRLNHGRAGEFSFCEIIHLDFLNGGRFQMSPAASVPARAPRRSPGFAGTSASSQPLPGG